MAILLLPVDTTIGQIMDEWAKKRRSIDAAAKESAEAEAATRKRKKPLP